MRVIVALITVLFATPAWADWIAVMDATADNRVAKYAKFENEAEAQAHVDKFIEKYPKAFHVERPLTPFSAWKIDMENKSIAIDVPVEPIIKSIESEATKRINDVVGDERKQKQALARAARLNAEVAIKGRNLTAEEEAEVDHLIAVDDYTTSVRSESERFINKELSNLTEEQKLNFNPATDIDWPVAP